MSININSWIKILSLTNMCNRNRRNNYEWASDMISSIKWEKRLLKIINWSLRQANRHDALATLFVADLMTEAQSSVSEGNLLFISFAGLNPHMPIKTIGAHIRNQTGLMNKSSQVSLFIQVISCSLIFINYLFSLLCFVLFARRRLPNLWMENVSGLCQSRERQHPCNWRLSSALGVSIFKHI